MTAAQINKYLRAKVSPLAGKGAVFIREARRNGLDPLLLVAITGAESSFGTQTNGSFNPFGWGPGIDFRSWDDGIAKVARGLRIGYADQGLKTISQIGGKWAPVGAGNDPTNLNSNWTRNVGRFYGELGGQGVAVGTAGARMTLPPSALPPVPAISPPTALPDLTGFALGNLRQLASGKYDPGAALSELTSQLASNSLAAAPAQVPISAPLAPTGGANQPAAGALPQGLDSAFQTAINQLIAASGGKVWINSGYRSPERQAELFAAAVKKYGSEAAARKWVAPPGRSRHNMGIAADLGGDMNLAASLAPQFGLYRPMDYEPRHWELQGSRN